MGGVLGAIAARDEVSDPRAGISLVCVILAALAIAVVHAAYMRRKRKNGGQR